MTKKAEPPPYLEEIVGGKDRRGESTTQPREKPGNKALRLAKAKAKAKKAEKE